MLISGDCLDADGLDGWIMDGGEEYAVRSSSMPSEDLTAREVGCYPSRFLLGAVELPQRP